MNDQRGSTFWQRPSTRLGWWAFGLFAAFVVMFIINTVVFIPTAQGEPGAGWREMLLPFYGLFMMLCGLVGAILGVIALMRKQERTWMVWVTLLPGILVTAFVLGEILVPH